VSCSCRFAVISDLLSAHVPIIVPTSFWPLASIFRSGWTKLRKPDHIYVEGTLVSSTYQKEFGNGKVTVPLKAWQVIADSIRKLNRTRKDQVPATAPLDTQPEEVPF
jgi:hypothetical protein